MRGLYFNLEVVSNEDAFRALEEASNEIPANPQRPLFILLEMINEFDESDEPLAKYEAIDFSLENLTTLELMLNHPNRAWEIWKDNENSVSSDVVSKISTQSKDPSERQEYPDVWDITKIGLFDTDDEEAFEFFTKHTPFKNLVNSFPQYTTRQNHNNGLFNAKFDPKYVFDEEKLSKFDTDKEKAMFNYWKEMKNNPNILYEKIQFPIGRYEQYSNLITPCVIYSMQRCGIARDIIDEIENGCICYGNIVKTRKLREILSNHNIAIKIYKISKDKNNKVTITNDVYPRKNKENWPMIELDYYEGHLMKHEIVTISNIKEYNVPLLRLIFWAFCKKILIKMSAYEFAVRCGGELAYFIKNNNKELIEYLKTSPDPFKYSLNMIQGSDKKSPTNYVFADFECSTNEKYHREFLISFTTKQGNINHFWGEKCGQQFLDYLYITFGDGMSRKFTNTACTVYFHNLRYDFTFLLKYLSKLKITKKGDRLYRVKGQYGSGSNKMWVEFRDTLPLLQMTLKKSGEAFLNEEQKKTIKKEAFPYELYTFDFFETHGSGWCDLQEFRAGFKNDQLLEEFDRNLSTLPESIYDPLMEIINYKNYAFFYCDQDVRVLQSVMGNYEALMTGGGAEGIDGVPPFGNKYSPFKYLTISSLAYDYCLKNTVLKRGYKTDENGDYELDSNGKKIPGWEPRFPYYLVSTMLRHIGHKTVRGGRVMTRDNVKWYYKATEDPLSLLVDYDGVSLYPSAISLLWMTEGKPEFIYIDDLTYDELYFQEHFTNPDAPEGEFKDFNDGWIHLTYLDCQIERHFPLLCIKDPKTKLNDYQNFHGEVDTWVNAIDLFNLIDFQNTRFKWDCAVVWRGPRHYECRSMIKDLFEFRAKNKKHPIQLTTKLMMNSIYGKSALKPVNFEEEIIDKFKYRKEIKWEKVDNWRETFNANAYRIKSFTLLDDDHVSVKFHKFDNSFNNVAFGSNVLAMARRIIGRVMALAEDMEKEHPECAPGLFYTDTDSMHIRKDLLQYTEAAYLEKYGKPIKGSALCQFHIDFDPPKTYKKGEEVVGADESYFIMKKMYADQLVGSQGSIDYHKRMKGIPTDLVNWEHYNKIYNNEIVNFGLLEKGHVSFFYENGHVGSRREMHRMIGTREAKKQLKDDLDVITNFNKRMNQLEKQSKRPHSDVATDVEDEEEEPVAKLPRCESLPEFEYDSDSTNFLPPEPAQPEFDPDTIIDIE